MTTINARAITETTTKGRLTAKARRALAELFAINAALKERGQPLLMPRQAQWAAPRQLTGLIGLSMAAQVTGEKRVKTAHPRKQNIGGTEPGYNSGIREQPFTYCGKFKGWHGSNLFYVMQSVGTISHDRQSLGVIVDGRPGFIRAGRGYHWSVDRLGIKLVQTRTGADYHPDSDQVFAGFAVIRAALLSRLAARAGKKSAPLKILMEKLKNSDQLIAVSDSIAAGNCKVGSEAFCRLIGVDPRHPLPVGRLILAVQGAIEKIDDNQKNRLAATLARLCVSAAR